MDKVWQLIYSSFEEAPTHGFRSISATNGTRNEIQFRLQRALSEYNKSASQEQLDAIVADVNLCNAMGYISNESFENIMTILDKEGN